MSTYVYESKLTGESLDVVTSFLSRLVTGETITTCASAISVSSGIDATPSTMLSGSPTISGTDVTQKVVAGLPGVIYTLFLSARSSLNNVFVQEIKIAVLTSQAAIPV